MKCISPLRLRIDGTFQDVPCGKCNFCLLSRRMDWTLRLVQESKRWLSCYFITLTYDDQHLPADGSLVKEDFQKFMKRLRKDVSPVKLRFYAVGEYGTVTQRAHYHVILFNLPDREVKYLDFHWQKGNVHVGEVSLASIHYVTKYHVNRYGDHGGREPPFAFMSRNPGLGQNYLTQEMISWHKLQKADYAKVNGVVTRLPRYYRERVFSALERSRFKVEAVDRGVEQYWREVERLMKFHPDPEGYYDACMSAMHESIKSKNNKFNRF